MEKQPYTWKIYVDRALRARTRIAAMDSGVETQKFISDILRQALERMPKEIEA